MGEVRVERVVGYVYFIQAGDSGPIKIGWAKEPSSRITMLQTGSWQPLTLLAAVRGTERREAALHVRFKADRVLNEWFAPTEELLEVVRLAAAERDEERQALMSETRAAREWAARERAARLAEETYYIHVALPVEPSPAPAEPPREEET